jgi:peptide chain release factor 2
MTFLWHSRNCEAPTPNSRTLFEYPSQLEKLKEIEKLMADAGFWNDQDKANAVIARLKDCKAAIEPLDELETMMEEADIMIELAGEDGGDEALGEAEEFVSEITGKIRRLEFYTMLDGEHDKRNAFLVIQAGAGGVESCDWAKMLLRMYMHWIESSGYEAKVYDILYEEEAGIKSATLLVEGRWVYGYLQAEKGIHRLVRVSPFDAQNRRHTSFAAVDVTPELDDDIQIDIDAQEIRIDTYRAGGAGGQHVNKTDSAVRITHIPTGVVVQCQNERSQHKNKAMALKMLKAKLFAEKEKERDEEMKNIQGGKSEIAWGHQIRSYVLHPYSLVKDHRTGVETGNVNAVLDGAINQFMEPYLRSRKKR